MLEPNAPATEKTLIELKRLMQNAFPGGQQGGGTTPRTSVSAGRVNAGQEKALRESIIATSKAIHRLGNKALGAENSLSKFKKQTDEGAGGLKNLKDRADFGSTGLEKLKEQTDVSVNSLKDLQTQSDFGKTSLEKFTEQSGLSASGLHSLTGAFGSAFTSFTTARTQLTNIDFSTSFDTLQSAVAAAAATISSTPVGAIDTSAITTNFDKLNKILDEKINPRFDKMRLKLLGTNLAIDSFATMLKAPGVSAAFSTLGAGLGVLVSSMTRRGGIGTHLSRMELLLRAVNAQLRATRAILKNGGGAGGGGDGRDGGDLSSPDGSDKGKKTFFGGLKTGFIKIFDELRSNLLNNLVAVAEDAFEVTGSRGYGVFTSNLTTLSVNAAMAGMSLRDYTKMMDENMGLVSRSGSFEEFDKQLDVGRDALEKFGVFGEDATRLSMAMAGGAQSLGIPVTDLSKSVTGQMSVFENLRKSVGLTAESFGDLIKQLHESEIVQKELIGLAPEDRQKRLTQIAQTTAWGKQLGLSESAQRALTDSILAQRKSTVKERFQQRGRLGQAMSLVGMSPDKVARAQELASIRNKTDVEQKEYTRILGEYGQRSEELKQTGGPGMQFQVEAMGDKLQEAGVQKDIDAAMSVRAQEQTGPQKQKDINKTLSDLEITLGKAWAAFEGMTKSPLFMAGAGLLAVLAGSAYLVAQADLIGRAVARYAAGLGGPDVLGGRGGRGIGANIKNIGKAGVVAAALYGGMALMDYNSAEERAKPENGGDGDVEKLKKQAVAEGVGGTVGSIVGGLAGAFGGPIGVAIGSSIGGTVGKSIGTWWAGLESDEDKRAKEIAKNTEATKTNTIELTKESRAGAGVTVVSTSNLRSLTENATQTAESYSKVSDKKIAARVESQKTPEQKKKEAENASAAKIESSPVSTTPSSAAKIESSPVSTTPSIIATLPPTAVTSVIPVPVNTIAPQAIVQTLDQTQAATPSAISGSDQGSTLQQILVVLQQTLIAENAQIEIAAQMLRAPAFQSRLPDNRFMNRAVLAQS